MVANIPINKIATSLIGPKLKSLLSWTDFGVVLYDKNAAASMIPSRKRGGWFKKTDPMIMAKKIALCPPKNFHSSCAVSFWRIARGAFLKFRLSIMKKITINNATAISHIGHTFLRTQKNET